MSNPTFEEYYKHVMEQYKNKESDERQIWETDMIFPTKRDIMLDYYSAMDDEQNVELIMLGLDPINR